MMKSWEVIELKPLEQKMTEEAYKKLEYKILTQAAVRACQTCKVFRECTKIGSTCPIVNAIWEAKQ